MYGIIFFCARDGGYFFMNSLERNFRGYLLFENVCIIFLKNFFILEKGLTFAIGGEDSEYKNRDSF